MPNNKNSFSTKAKCPKNCRLQIKSGGCHIVTEGQWIGHNREQEIFRKIDITLFNWKPSPVC